MHNKIAHTAEHALIGSLQKLIGKTLHVRKVEHRQADNSVFITTPHLDLELIIKAQSEVNSLIRYGKKSNNPFFCITRRGKKTFSRVKSKRRTHRERIYFNQGDRNRRS